MGYPEKSKDYSSIILLIVRKWLGQLSQKSLSMMITAEVLSQGYSG